MGSGWDGATRRFRSLRERIGSRLLGGELRVVLILAAAALLVAVVATFAIQLLAIRHNGRVESTGETFWNALIRTLDPGQMESDRGLFAVVALVTTIVGLLLVSTLISLVNNAVQVWTERARRGREPARLHRFRSRNAPRYVILGWSGLSTKLLEELAQSQKRRAPEVIVMAEETVEWMREQCNEARTRQRKHLPKKWPQLRTGSPTHTGDLRDIAMIREADAVILLAPDPVDQRVTFDSPDSMCEASAAVVRSAFAVSAALEQSPAGDDSPVGKPRTYRVVVEIPENAVDAERLRDQLEHRFSSSLSVELLAVAGASIQARLAAQVIRKAGLNDIYRDLLDFEGCEFHVVPNSAGFTTFGEAVIGAAHSTVVGIARRNASQTSEPTDHKWDICLDPDWCHKLDGCELVVLQDEVGRIESRIATLIDDMPTGRRVVPDRSTDAEHVLVLGWNHRAEGLVRSLDTYLPAESRIVIIRSGVPTEADGPALPAADGAGWVTTLHSPVTHRISAPTVQWRTGGVQSWLDLSADRSTFQHAVVLADDDAPPAVSDANVFLSLASLHPPGTDNMNPETVVAELRKRSSRHLVSKRIAHDLIVGDALLALVLAQYAVESRVQAVLDDLIAAGTVEIDLIDVDQSWTIRTFEDLIVRCAHLGVTAIGYTEPGTYSAVLNPDKEAELGVQPTKVVVLNRSAAALHAVGAAGTQPAKS